MHLASKQRSGKRSNLLSLHVIKLRQKGSLHSSEGLFYWCIGPTYFKFAHIHKNALFHLAMSRHRRQKAGWKYLNNDHSSAATVTSAREWRLNLCQLSVLRRPCAGEHPQISVFRHTLFSEKICFDTFVPFAKTWIVASLLFSTKSFCSIFELPINRTLQQCVLEQSGTNTIIGDWRCASSIWEEVTKYQQNDDSGTAGCVFSGNV